MSLGLLSKLPRFNLSAAEIKKGTEQTVSAVSDSFEKFCKTPSIEKFGRAESKLYDPVLPFFQFVSSNPEVRKASEYADNEFMKFGVDLGKRKDVYDVLRTVPKLEGVDDRLKMKAIKEYQKNGLDLSAKDREELTRLEKELGSLCIQFNANIGADDSHCWFTREQLKGVPEQWFEGRFPSEKGYKVTCKAPDMQPVMKNCSVEETRKELFLLNETRVKENEPLFQKALKIRSEVAAMLGYQNHAAYVLEDRMAETPANVQNFLMDLVLKAKPAAEKEYKQFEKLKGGSLMPWDIPWCQTQSLSFDPTKLSDYFPTEGTIEQVFKVIEDAYKIEFRPQPLSDSRKWHPDLRCYALYRDDAVKGWIYLDLYPRPNKYPHFANFGLISGDLDHLPVTALVCNFPKSFLTHDDVVTFFHELGHGVHDILGHSKYARFSGTKVAHDFVETPSQLLENWAWEPAVLKRLSPSLPDELISQLVLSRTANAASFTLRQLFFGLFDLEAHTTPDFDARRRWNELRTEIIGISSPVELSGYTTFGHLMGGYDAGYYGYMWSLVFAADIWKNCIKKGHADIYVDKLLSKGGSEPENEQLRVVLGRPPTSDAFLESLGLLV